MTAGIGNVSSYNVTGNVVTVNLTGVSNAQRLGVTLKDVCNGTISGDVMIPMGVLKVILGVTALLIPLMSAKQKADLDRQ